MGAAEVYRSRFAQALAVVTVALCVLLLASIALRGRRDLLAEAGPWVLLFALAAWGAFWAPRVEVSDGGVTVRNVWRTIVVPWPAVREVDARYGLRLETAYGPVQAWAVPAPTGRARARAVTERTSTPAAEMVRRRLEELRAAGHLDHPVLESERADVRWHWPLITAAVALVLVGAIGMVR